VISIAGFAAVKDSDLQANLDRYLTETIFSPNISPELNDWAHIRETMKYYLARIIVCIKPSHVRWWSNRAAMDNAPQEWRAPANTVYSKSDPAIPGKGSAPPDWGQPTWQELRATALHQQMPSHLTLVDAGGHPLPMPVLAYKEHAKGFSLEVPKGAPWREGKATLSFIGKEIFVGDVTVEGSQSILHVERALPVWPLMTEAVASERTYAALMKRLDQELARRGQTLPVIPEQPPAPTAGAKLREAGYRALVPSSADADS
jgi:hypothetical protein